MKKILLVLACAVIPFLITSCKSQQTTVSDQTKLSQLSKTPQVSNVPFGCTQGTTPTFDPTNPKFLAGDTSALSPNQANVNCFAWQSFIAMNWPVDPSWPSKPDGAGEPDRTASVSTWGVQPDPTNTTLKPTVWETDVDVQNVFLANAVPPKTWGSQQERPSSCPAGSPGFHLVLNQNMEADGGWLTDQLGHQVWYGQHLGRAEFNYIVQNQLYNAAMQMKVATTTPGIDLPGGVAPSGKVQGWQDLGALEIKSAWRVLTHQPKLWHRYLLAKAWVQYSKNTCHEEIVGLVGLHILRKTQSFPTFMWSTFEQADNVPGKVSSDDQTYAFNNPHCQGKDCTPNVPRINQHSKPLYPPNQPVQTTRVILLSDDVQKLNQSMHKLIAAQTTGKSVFQYYELVDVLWPSTIQGSYTGPNQKTPLNINGGMQPTQAVANTTLETYIQRTTCTGCHAYATIAGSKKLASDYSFVLSHAKTSPGGRVNSTQASSKMRNSSLCEQLKHVVTRTHVRFNTYALEPSCQH